MIIADNVTPAFIGIEAISVTETDIHKAIAV